MTDQSPSEPWVAVALASLHARQGHPVLGPVQIFGAIRGFGQGWIVGVAYPSRDLQGRDVTVSGIVTLAPSAGSSSGWVPQGITTVEPGAAHRSSSRSQLCHFEVCGIWLLVGVLTGSDVGSILVRRADGTEIEPALGRAGVLIASEQDPFPSRPSSSIGTVPRSRNCAIQISRPELRGGGFCGRRRRPPAGGTSSALPARCGLSTTRREVVMAC